jgi:hypothetical protein
LISFFQLRLPLFYDRMQQESFHSVRLVEMRDLKDQQTLDLLSPLPEQATPAASAIAAPKAGRTAAGPRSRKQRPKQEQMELLEPTDASGLPPWTRDDSLDLMGLPIWPQEPA